MNTMSIMEEAGQRFDTGQLRHAVEDKDLDAMLALFTDDAEYRIISKGSPPSSPQVLHGRDEIGELMRDIFSRDLSHKLQNVVVEGDHVAFEEVCTYGDGTRVVGMSMADLVNGRIRRVTDIEAWDDVSSKHRADFAVPDETRTFDNGRLDLIHLDEGTVGMFRLEPGWRWSKDVRPIAGTELCQNEHFAFHISGTLRVQFSDGTEIDLKPGQVAHVPPGHDAWVVGDEPVSVLDWSGATHYAKK
ncbi:polyketide cyclase [Nocardiopsis gilva YIM 90087]|uniref:Polyketide cyclase n=3 Tax=Nocardiopsis gilva TaxID=280236 RepID=A0A223SDJ8_9ACTN|nr:polyketide cyclase [Nocardiopsis gilva YIM 90087]